MSTPIYTVDAFTSRVFAGNPAAVCLLEAPREADWMQAVAREMNLSETAFLTPRAGDGFDLRWFTPEVEVDLCGHATLASAHALWESGTLELRTTARFHTRSGVLTAARRGDEIELDFPARPVTAAEAPEGLREALGLAGSKAPVRFVGRNWRDVLIEVNDAPIVRSLVPDYAKLAKIDVRGVMVTSLPGPDAAGGGREHCDFVSRFFSPGQGIAEDPVTGSAHCALAPYWGAKLGKTEMVGYQASARGGTVRVRLEGERVILGGHAVTVLRGVLV